MCVCSVRNVGLRVYSWKLFDVEENCRLKYTIIMPSIYQYYPAILFSCYCCKENGETATMTHAQITTKEGERNHPAKASFTAQQLYVSGIYQEYTRYMHITFLEQQACCPSWCLGLMF